MNNLKKIKIKQYSKKNIASSYDKHRFAGKSGRYVNQIELNMLSKYFRQKDKLILDLACGTGRFTFHLMKKNKKVISLDSSKEMILQARKKGKGNFILGDMFNLPFEDNYFDGVVIGRVFQHFGDISPILSQAKRVLKSGGIITFDTWIWSPRSFHRLFSKNHPKAVYNHSISSIKKTLKKQGLKLIKYEGRFLLPPGIYRMFPFFIVRILNLIEKAIPNFLRNKTFWKVTKI